MEVKVTYVNNGDVHTFQTGGPVVPEIVVDNNGFSPDERAGTAKHFLASGILLCYMSSFIGAMKARDVRFSNATATGTLELGKNDKGQARVTKMTIDVHADVNKEDEDVFERVQKIMRQGCILSGSVEEGIAMEYNVNATFA